MRTVTVELKLKLLMKVDEGVRVSDIVDDMDCTFKLPDNATFEDSEILDYEVKDTVELKLKLLMKVDEGVRVSDIVNDMDCTFELPDNATFEDIEILDYEVKDSK